MKIMFEGTHEQIVQEMKDYLGITSKEATTLLKPIGAPLVVDTPQEEIKIIKGNPEPSPYKKGHVITGELLDSAGETWDSEKHSSTKSMTADGKWKKKRQSKKTEAKPEEPSLAKDIMAECSRLLSADADMLEITTAALAHAGFEDQSKVWVPDAPKEKLEKYLEYLKSK